MKKVTVSAGEKFNSLTVIEMLGVNEKGFSVAKCRCDCGKEAVVKVAELRSGHKKSCGCQSWVNKSAERSKEIVGKKFGRLLVKSLCGTDSKSYRLCMCECACGQKVKIRIAQMLAGTVLSCGCMQKEKAMQNLAKAQKSATIHGMWGTLTGKSWSSMMGRCYNFRTNESFHRYGAMGIVACAFIRSSPLNLLLLIGERQAPEISLDRIDTRGNYSCGSCEECLKNGWPMNVRWATKKQQALNRTNNRMIEIDGVTKTASEWRELTGLSMRTFYTYPKKK